MEKTLSNMTQALRNAGLTIQELNYNLKIAGQEIRKFGMSVDNIKKLNFVGCEGNCAGKHLKDEFIKKHSI